MAEREPETEPGEAPLRITSGMVLRRRVDFERRLRRAPPATLGLLVTLALVFVLTSWGLDDEEAPVAVLSGALYRDDVLAGEWWRLVTATLLHGGVGHLLGNALGLYVLGLICEHAYGGAQLLVVWAAGALAGWAASLATGPGPTLGASGAIFGLQGAAIVLFARHRSELLVRHKRIGVVLAAWMLYAVVDGHLTPMVDNAAHVGGALGGALVALVLAPAVLRPLAPARLRGFRSLACVVGAAAVWACVEWIRSG